MPLFRFTRPSPEALEAHIRAQVEAMATALKQHENQVFSLVLDQKPYRLKYTLDGTTIRLWAITDDAPEWSMVRPALNLNLGALLLPESLCVDGTDGQGYNPQADNGPGYREVQEAGIPESEATALVQAVKNRGLLNLVRKSAIAGQ